MPSTAILVVSDRPIIRQGIVSVIFGQPHIRIIGEMDNAAATSDLYKGTRPHIVIVDLCASEALGMLILKKIQSQNIAAKIIILTSSQDERCIKKFIEVGASAVLLINISSAGLIDTIRSVLAGEKRIDPQLAERLYLGLVPRLSAREVEVLAGVAKGYTNSKIGALLGIAAETVKTHLKNLLSKLGASNRTEAVIIAMKRGLLEL